MKLTSIFCVSILGILNLLNPQVSAQEISIDTSSFEEDFPEEKYLFSLTKFEHVLYELELSEGQRTELTELHKEIDVKHQQHIDRVSAIRDEIDREKVEALLKRFRLEISPEIAQVKKLLTKEQLTRIRQIAFQYYFVGRNLRNDAVDTGRLLLEKSIADGLRLNKIQQITIADAYQTLEDGLKELDSDDNLEYLKLISDTHRSILACLDAQQKTVVNDVVGPPAQAHHRPGGD